MNQSFFKEKEIMQKLPRPVQKSDTEFMRWLLEGIRSKYSEAVRKNLNSEVEVVKVRLRSPDELKAGIRDAGKNAADNLINATASTGVDISES